MELYKLKFQISGVPSSGNAKLDKHKLAQYRENKKWHKKVFLAVRNQLPAKPLNKCELHLIRYGSMTLDYDNLVISFKSIVDGLSEAGVIADDSYAVTGKWDVDQIKSTRKDAHVEIIVYGLPYDGPDIKSRRIKKSKKLKINRPVRIPRFSKRAISKGAR